MTRMGIFDADLRRLTLKDAEKDPGGRGTRDADNTDYWIDTDGDFLTLTYAD